ncbi:hypothetical protein QQS21_002272 [Conoideocrella luteorostrata]|uniref:Uncharacterized protein n=1 Tax=Conoideocrella luteorostrata TaxID=1105319 RepID=A0AAJ0CYC4_9HYPO|nr:hypothetical protein QQS21_002272 [Conoideocrella luteorostrata]
MKGLMPLALSPNSSSSWTSNQSAPADEGMAERVDDYLPELLARDLEISAAIFAAKKMTAGIPTDSIPSEDKTRIRAGRMSLYSPYHAASARVQSLGPIEERDSMVSFMGQGSRAIEGHISESASTTSHYSSDGAEPPSFRHRGSVVTTDTSVASVGWRPKSSPSPEGPYECSWIDGDSDREDQDHDPVEEVNIGSLSPRPPTPPSSELGSPISSVMPRADIPTIWTHPSHAVHRKSRSVGGGSPITSRGQLSGLSPDLPLRSSSFTGTRQLASIGSTRNTLSQTFGTSHHRKPNKPERTQSLRINTTINAFASARARNMALEPSLMRESSPVSDDFPGSDCEAIHPPGQQLPAEKPNTVFVRPPTPPQPLRSVQSWLNSSLQPYPWAFQNEDNAKAVPLPPEAVETLRVSVACFPETMLLTSSLTVETIRSYAKKVRQPSMDSLSIMNRNMSPHSPRKSLWRKVVTYTRGSQLSDVKIPSRGLGSRHGISVGSNSPAETVDPKLWLPIKNVFGCCSDYICDALYAHIVAYNYVSALVARNPRPLASHGRTNTMSTGDPSQQDDIPKKAASLLGLAVGTHMAGRYSKRVSSPLADWTREGMVTNRDAAPTAQDNALRVIQSGLLRCVSRLIATAKLMAESGTGEERMVDMEAEDADMLFMRSLCEIVRMAEESS